MVWEESDCLENHVAHVDLVYSDLFFIDTSLSGIHPLFFQDIDIKKVNGVPQYAFLQYCDIASVCKAIKKMDGEYLGNNRLKVKEFI